MLFQTIVALSALLPLIQAEETVLGVYVFHRHGDRTPKAFKPAELTPLGYSQVFSSGNYYRNRYIDSNTTSAIFGVSSDIAKNSQLSVEAPTDVVLQNSAAGFLQGLYPAVGPQLGTQSLRNGSNVEAPLNGYQLIPVNTVQSAASGANSENSAWLQGQSGCYNAIVSSNNYFSSKKYKDYLNTTNDFYQSLLPVINSTFDGEYDTFKNAYSIYDLIHVATIHNKSIPSEELLTSEALQRLQVLANIHEFDLAFNETEQIRAIQGSTLAAQILQQLNSTIVSQSKSKMGIQFGAYAVFLSFFGLAQLPKASDDFTGIVNYAASMSFELVTNATVSQTSYPSNDDISVRFLFTNGSAAEQPLTAYPLFGKQETVLPWNSFVDEMNKFAIGDQVDWCKACGNSTGVCASPSASTSSSSSEDGSTSSSKGMSKAVAGVIGAMVTLGVILGAEALVLLLGGLRLVSKKRLSSVNGSENAVPAVKA